MFLIFLMHVVTTTAFYMFFDMQRKIFSKTGRPLDPFGLKMNHHNDYSKIKVR